MKGRIVTTDVGGEFEAAGLNGDHGGKWETSFMLARDPSLVDLSEFDKHPDLLGVMSGANAVESTEEQGLAWLNECAQAVAQEARWLVENYPELPARHRHRR